MSTVTLRPRNKRRVVSDENKEPISKRSKSRQTATDSKIDCEMQRSREMQTFVAGQNSLEILSCRENLPATLKLKGHAYPSQLYHRPIPSEQQLQENIPPGPAPFKHSKTTRKPTLTHCTRALASSVQSFRTNSFPVGLTPSPLPELSWTDSDALWHRMRAKDSCMAAPETDLLSRHPLILPNMRTILLDWMLEVCEEYKQHRETYYLAMNIYDRYMDTSFNIQKEQLQLIGITCLFIASKIEEIYPPKVNDFAYVTDGACSTQQILDAELNICKALNWRLSEHITVNTWMNTYLQLTSTYFRPPGLKAKEFEYPAYSALEFIRAMQVLDLGMLNICCRQFSSSILAASALFLVSEKCQQHLKLITGLQLSDISVCVQWLSPYSTVIIRRGHCTQKSFRGVFPQDAHNIQTHDITLAMLDEVIDQQRYQEQQMDCSLHSVPECSAFMTPPRQERRFLAPLNSTTV